MKVFKGKDYPFVYFFIGFCFGLCFPIGAMVLEFIIKTYPVKLGSILLAHNNNKLLFMIDTAPIFLGLFALLGGISKKKSYLLAKELQKILFVVEEENINLNQNAKFLLDESDKLNINMKLEESELFLLKNNYFSLKDNMVNIVENIKIQTTFIQEVSSNISKFLETINELNANIKNICEISGSFIKLTEKISDIGSLIKEISKKTNLLAINATIEAARVGEAGTGFTIIGKEIKILADNSQKSVEQIELISQDIQKNAKFLLDMTGEIKVLEEIKESSKNITNISFVLKKQEYAMKEIEKVLLNLGEKSIEIEKISLNQLEEEREIEKSVNSMAKTYKSTKNVGEKISEMSKNLSSLSNNLIKTLKNLK